MEILVVVGIIAILFAIIFSVTSTVRESARRAQCASNLRQVAAATKLLAVNHDGFYRLSHKELAAGDQDDFQYSETGLTSGKADHFPWLRKFLVDRYQTEAGLDLKTFSCPARAYGDGVDYLRLNQNPLRIGYFLIAGRRAKDFDQHPIDGRFITPPTKLSDSAKYLLAADVIEEGTHSGVGSSTENTSAPHGQRGLVAGPDSMTAAQIGSQGGNFAYNDGSVVWEPQSGLHPNASATDATRIGEFPDLDPNKPH